MKMIRNSQGRMIRLMLLAMVVLAMPVMAHA